MLSTLLLMTVFAQDDSLTTRTYDLQAILASSAHERDGLSPWWQLPGIEQIYATEEAFPLEEELSVSLGDFLAIVRQVVAATPGATVDEILDEEGRCIISGNEAAHGAIARAVESLETEALASVFIEAFRVEAQLLGNDRSAVLSSERAAELSARAADAPRILGHTQPGRLTSIGRETMVQYVQDYDVEVAQFQGCLDPTVNRAALGTLIRIRIDRSHDGVGLITRVWGRNSSMGTEMRRRPIQAYGGAVVEHPVVDAAQFVASARLEAGGALVLDPGHPDGRVLVVRCHSDLAPRRASDPMVDFGWLLSPLQRHLPMQLPDVEPSRGLGPIDEDVELATLPWADERANLSDLITRLLSDDTTVRGRRIGASAVVACSPEERTLLRSAIAEHATSGPCRTLEVTSAHLEVAPQDLVRALTDDDALARLCEGAAVRRFGSVFGHDTLSLAGGTLTTHIQDHDVQIAQAASAGDPIVRPLFDGGSLWCSPLRVSEDRIVAWFDAGHQEGFKDPRIVETFLSSPAIGSPAREGLAADFEDLVLKIDLELASTREIHGRALLALVPGKWTVLAAQPYDSDEMVQLIAVKASLVER